MSWREGARAAEELASALVGFSIRKAIDPLTDAGFLLICDEVAKRLRAAAVDAEADVVQEAIDDLDLDWATLSGAATAAAMKAIDTAIAEAYSLKVINKLGEILAIEGPKVMEATKLALIASEHIEIVGSLSQRDLAAEEAIRTQHLNFIRYSTGERAEALSQKARDAVARGVEQGLSSTQIGADLKKMFENDIPRPDSYWNVVADAFVGRGRTTSQIYSYEDAGVEAYELVAVLDEVTTDICRFMDGKVFHVSAARGLIDKLNDMPDPEDVRYTNPWIRKGRDEDGGMRLYVPHADGTTTTIAKIERSGVGSRDDRGAFSDGKSESELAALGVPVPPFHGRCRTVIVAAAG